MEQYGMHCCRHMVDSSCCILAEEVDVGMYFAMTSSSLGSP